MSILTESAIEENLKQLSGWNYNNRVIERLFQFPNFLDAMQFVNRVAEAAEKANHHPDIDIRYNKVTMLLTSHDVGGVTSRDLRMAKKISELASP
jgi:4a-hydroxytetrahydrobiopterin dehydratase